MNRKGFLFSLMAVLALAAGIAILNPAGATAQINPCTCRMVPIVVDPGVCNILIRVTRPGETPFILGIGGGNTVSVQCADGITFELSVGGCWVDIGTNCNNRLGATGGCCVSACLEQPAAGCWQVHIRPQPGPCLTCADEQEDLH